ncbi:MAG: hybrid sensor histidine kinase/response regulator [Nitrospirota bacterium]
MERSDMKTNIRVLLVEDDSIDQTAFKRFVAGQRLPYDLSVAGSVAEATAALGAAKFDIIIADFSLGDGTALDILAQAKDTPVVVVTGTGTEATAVNALKAGAYDYLIKDHDRYYLNILPITVENAIRRFKAEEASKRFYAELETKVKERTRELAGANRLLQEALVMAEAGLRARGAFLANISHELTTPLNSVIGFSQLLLDGLGGPMNEQQKNYAASILQGGNRLHETLKEIVQFAGLESGEMKLHTDRFLLKDFLKSSLLALNEKAAVQGVALSLELGLPPETELEADRAKLQQALFNLLDNAVKFTPAGGSVRVSARLIRNEDEKTIPHSACGIPHLEISVTDTGIGIKEEDIPRLFQPFQQLESPYTKKYKGTGLGLMLARKIVELHGGRIWAESEFGKGSRFVFAIPVERTAAKEDAEGLGDEGALRKGETDHDHVQTRNSLRR